MTTQDIMLYGTAEHRKPGGLAYLDYSSPPQAAALRAINPKQQQWFYYAIDLVRPHDFESDGNIEQNSPECLLHDDAGVPVTRTVWVRTPHHHTPALLLTREDLMMVALCQLEGL